MCVPASLRPNALKDAKLFQMCEETLNNDVNSTLCVKRVHRTVETVLDKLRHEAVKDKDICKRAIVT